MTSRIAGPLRGLPHPLARLDGPLELVRQFTPSWFTAAMGTGTGIVALALNQPPFSLPGAQAIARGLRPFDIVLFVLFAALYLARRVLFFEGARRIFGHSVMSMFFGAISMGLDTIINGRLVFGPP